MLRHHIPGRQRHELLIHVRLSLIGSAHAASHLVAPWIDWQRRCPDGRRLLEAGTYALTEGAIAAGCRVFAGYPITPATDIAEYMSKRLPQVGGYYMQCEDELAGMHTCAGASLGGLKAMTATSGPGYTLMHDAYGWSLTNEIPLVVVDAMRPSSR
jgi:pyruvate/2-oxoacid:ferredoxin oxidoreductase alpha subunit